MKNMLKQVSSILLYLLPTALFAWHWQDLWQTADQQGAQLLRAGKAEKAAKVFKNQDWRAVADYRDGKYAQSLQRFKSQKTSDGQYNAGNAYAHLGRYQEAIAAYDKAIALNPNNKDAFSNREIIKKLMDKKNQQNNSSSSQDASHSKNASDSKESSHSQGGTSGTKDSASNTKETSTGSKDSASEANSAASSKKEEDQLTENNSAHNQSSEGQKEAQISAAQNSNDETNGEQNDPQNDNTQDINQNLQRNDLASAGNNKRTSGQKKDAKQDKTKTSAANQWQAQDEAQKQLLRRLPDEPGGLLRQKFLRDYVRRHSDEISAGGF